MAWVIKGTMDILSSINPGIICLKRKVKLVSRDGQQKSCLQVSSAYKWFSTVLQLTSVLMAVCAVRLYIQIKNVQGADIIHERFGDYGWLTL